MGSLKISRKNSSNFEKLPLLPSRHFDQAQQGGSGQCAHTPPRSCQRRGILSQPVGRPQRPKPKQSRPRGKVTHAARPLLEAKPRGSCTKGKPLFIVIEKHTMNPFI